jgi:hypothetical protein
VLLPAKNRKEKNRPYSVWQNPIVPGSDWPVVRMTAQTCKPVRASSVAHYRHLSFAPQELTSVYTSGTGAVLDWMLFPYSLEPTSVVLIDCMLTPAPNVVGRSNQIMEHNNLVELLDVQGPAIAESQDEEEVVEFRCLAPRVESIAELRHKVKLGKSTANLTKRLRGHVFQIEDEIEEQSE